MPKEKVYVPVLEPKTTSYVEYIELGRIVTPCPVFKKDTVRVRLLQRNLGNPAETFDTEKNWEYDIPWSEEKVEVKPVRTEEENVSTHQAPESEWGKKKVSKKRSVKKKVANALSNVLK
jgi:hypothetical protein